MARGYNIMKGYYKMPEATAAAIDKDGWLHTGDLARRDENGYYKITGRIKDMIIRGGENIYPKEIEDFIYTHPKVQDVQVIGVPDKQYGEEIMACIILKPGETATVEEIKRVCGHPYGQAQNAPVRGLCGCLPHERGGQDSEIQDARAGRGDAQPPGGQRHRNRVIYHFSGRGCIDIPGCCAIIPLTDE